MQNSLLQSLFKKQLIQNNLFYANQLITISFQNILFYAKYIISTSLKNNLFYAKQFSKISF